MSAALAKIEAKLKGYDDPWIGRPHPPPQGGCHMTSSGGPLMQARAMVGQAPYHQSSRLPSKIKWVFPLNSCRFQNRHTEPRFDWSDLPTSFAHLPHFASLVSTHARGIPCLCNLPVALNVRRWREMRSVQHTHTHTISLSEPSRPWSSELVSVGVLVPFRDRSASTIAPCCFLRAKAPTVWTV